MIDNKKRPGLLGGGPVSSAGRGDVPLPEYTMLGECLQLGGRLLRLEDACEAWKNKFSGFEKFKRLERARVSVASGKVRTIEQGVLSTAHISPGIEPVGAYFEGFSGASVFKVCRDAAVSEQVGGGKRSRINQFSYASRRRLMLRIGQIRRDAVLPAFVTLTYPAEFPVDPKVWKKHLDTFSKRLKRKFHRVGAIWKLEPQERGAAHFHLLVWGCDLEELKEFVPLAWYQIAGGGDQLHFLWHTGRLGHGNVHCVQQVRSFAGVWSYAAKYLGKTFQVAGWSYVGRFWGVINSQNIPFGEKYVIEVEKNTAVVAMRYQRRFISVARNGKKTQRKKKAKGNKKTMMIFCDADQWLNRLL